MGRVVKQRRNNAKGKPRGKPFEPGNTIGFKPGDPRINRNGRPKDHDQLRALIQALAGEEVIVKGETMTRIEAMLLKMFASHLSADRQNILEHGFGRVPQEIKLSTDDELRQLGADPEAIERDLAIVIAASAAGHDAASDPASGGGADEASGRNSG